MTSAASRTWLYFGCRSRNDIGHFLSAPGMRTERSYALTSIFNHFDGVLCPHPERGVGPYLAAFSRLGGLGYSALSFWDYSADKRSASNANFFAPNLTISAEDMLEQSKQMFPEVWARLPEVRLWRAVA